MNRKICVAAALIVLAGCAQKKAEEQQVAVVSEMAPLVEVVEVS